MRGHGYKFVGSGLPGRNSAEAHPNRKCSFPFLAAL
jgi:hypothetical protein